MPWKIPFRSVLVAAAALALTACSLPGGSSPAPAAGTPEISRQPPAADYSSLANKAVSLTVPTSTDSVAVDLRHHDMSNTDLSQAKAVLFDFADFDTATKWPAVLPEGYNPEQILNLGKDPGLGVRELHRQGITGKGIRVAFLDQTLLVDHEEYKDSIERYREIGDVPEGAQMHGPAVLSILSGKSLGVAPEVKVTYYAVDHLDGNKVTWVNHAKAIHQILDENAKLPLEQRIRVIGVSLGYSPDWGGYKEIREAVARAKEAGVFVLTTSVESDYTFKFHGLGRDPLADPKAVSSYRPGAWWAAQYYSDPERSRDRILAPMDSRTTAGPTGASAYAFYRQGGWSWVVPYLEGVYAMGLQVKPDLTPEEFYQAALETGDYSEFTRDGKSYRLGPIINPAALIKKLQGK
ncbi:MAG TPA: S8 family serine peptidase [Symbiobacteriaceae bacterium]|nr:S8 family serine peptidase [Symbiobacteriaceae bacterium]